MIAINSDQVYIEVNDVASILTSFVAVKGPFGNSLKLWWLSSISITYILTIDAYLTIKWLKNSANLNAFHGA